MMLPLSAQQLDVLRLLRDEPRTAAELTTTLAARDLPSAMPSCLRALNQRCLIKYVGGRGVKLGRGRWSLTAHGIATLRELGELPPLHR